MSRLRNIPGAEETLKRSPYVIQDPTAYRGKWRDEIFQNDHPLHLEIGMGKGKFLADMAVSNPQINYVGMEMYASVLIKALRKLDRMKEDTAQFVNLRLVCRDARAVPEIFAPGEVEVIYLNFSDPWPKARHANRRLTAAPFLSRYNQILSDNGRIEFKTDNQNLFDFSLKQVRSSENWEAETITYDLHQDPKMNAENVLTEYEEKYGDHPICKMIIRHHPAAMPASVPDKEQSGPSAVHTDETSL